MDKTLMPPFPVKKEALALVEQRPNLDAAGLMDENP